jgi:hypothetical protein
MNEVARITNTTAQLKIRRYDGGQLVAAQPWESEAGKLTVKDGPTIDFDSEDSEVNVRLANIRGTACPVIRTIETPLPLAIYPRIRSAFRGVHLRSQAADCLVNSPQIMGCRDEGIWAEASNPTILGGHIFGCGCAVRLGGGEVASEGGIVSGTTMSDAVVCCDILRPNVTVTGCFSQTGFSKNFNVIGHSTTITATRITTGRPSAKYPAPIGVDLAAWPAANDAVISDCKIYVHSGATGIVARSQALKVDARIECGPDAVAFRTAEAISDARIYLVVTSDDQSHPGVVDLSGGVGANTTVEVVTKGTQTKVLMTAMWPETSTVTVDGVVKPGK